MMIVFTTYLLMLLHSPLIHAPGLRWIVALCRLAVSLPSLAPGTPSLRHIQIYEVRSTSNNEPHPSVLRFVEAWIGNSATAPLDVSLNLSQRETIPEDPIADEILSLIFTHQDRWRTYSLFANFELNEELDPFAVRCWDSVKSVSLCSPGLFVVLDLSSAVISNGIGAVQLQELNVLSWDMDWVFPAGRNTLHLPNLRKLSFNTNFSLDLGDSFTLLSACPNILRLDIDSRDPLAPTLKSGTALPILLPHLIEFRIMTSDEAVINHFLDTLTCPSLANCHLLSSAVGTPRNLRSISSFLCRGSVTHPRLACLVIRYESVNGVPFQLYHDCTLALRRLLGALKSLERLSLGGLILDEPVFNELTTRAITHDSRERTSGDDDLLCPLLSHFHSMATNKRISLQNDEFDIEE
ncbi:hypothetical protein SCHPADRAFT_911393 [Schizopora paradoxa]|uniref:F-box domain-containing protein n=1 Tax=Schizopora paradoxa TaxID=27342 RepID=A0A0H2QZL4_9AGAM|nr:hypothetical protein SCHPADRAFT_911393 [Schizopora paradoxa]